MTTPRDYLESVLTELMQARDELDRDDPHLNHHPAITAAYGKIEDAEMEVKKAMELLEGVEEYGR